MLKPVQATDTSVFLWDYYFKARVPALQSTSVDYLKVHGTYITGDRGIDQTSSSQWITTMLPISRMVEYFADGVLIKIVNESDIKTIYEYISNHLEAWKHRLEHGINIGDAPIEDLVAMDRFANSVYEHAKYHFTEESLSSLLARQLGGVTRINKQTFFTNKLEKPKDQIGEDGIIRINQDDPYPERDSLADFLKSRLVGLKRWN